MKAPNTKIVIINTPNDQFYAHTEWPLEPNTDRRC